MLDRKPTFDVKSDIGNVEVQPWKTTPDILKALAIILFVPARKERFKGLTAGFRPR